MSAPLAIVAARPSVFDLTDEQRQIVRDTYASGCTDAEFALLMEIARTRRLNPLLKQIHFVQRWDSEKHRMVWAAQVSIDGLRAIAQRTGLYNGQDEAEFVENADGTIKLCKVRVWRSDWPRPAVGVAYWSEYVQTTRDKTTGKTRPTAMWARMPHVMLAKVAESIALRKAFPEDMAGLYTTDEMAQATVEVPEPQAPAPTVTATATAPAYTAPELPAPAATPTATATTEAPAPAADAPVAPPQSAERRVERTEEPVEPPPVELPAAAEGFYTRIGEIELPGEAVAVWMKHRAELASLSGPDREAAWKALCKRTEDVGKMKNSKVWLKKAIAEEEARRAAAEKGPGATWTKPANEQAVA